MPFLKFKPYCQLQKIDQSMQHLCITLLLIQHQQSALISLNICTECKAKMIFNWSYLPKNTPQIEQISGPSDQRVSQVPCSFSLTVIAGLILRKTVILFVSHFPISKPCFQTVKHIMERALCGFCCCFYTRGRTPYFF